jgi:uncharacterized membrane protein YfcA
VDPALIALCMLIVCIAGLVQGTTGFGSALVMVPFLSLIFLPREVVPITLVLGTVINLGILVQEYKQVQLRLVTPMILASAVAIPLGTLMILIISADAIRMMIGIVIVPFAIILFFGWRLKVRNEAAASIPAGFLSGLLNGSVTMSGPPLVLFLQNQGFEKASFRANIAALFMANNLVTFVTFYLAGLFTVDSMKLSALFLPAVLVGLGGGILLARRMTEGRFKKVALLLLIAAGLSSLISGIIGLAG